MQVLLLSAAEMAEIVTMKDIIQADKDALSIYSAGGADIPLRANLNVAKHNGQSLYMPGYAADAEALGIKIVSVYPNNPDKGKTAVPATMVLLDSSTGEVCALLDGTYLTRMRTGAVAGAATDLLARQDSKVFALFGTGGQAEGQLEAVLCVRPIEQVFVFDIDHQRAQEFAKAMQAKFGEKYNVQISASEDADKMVEQADVITAVTTSKQPVFNASKLKAGAHINGVGSYTPEMQEILAEVLEKASKIYLDTRDGVLHESGDFITPIKAGKFSVEKVTGELGEAINGEKPLRENDTEITFFKSTGSAVLDIVVAKHIYDLAVAQKKGQEITL
ncbi:ornithine cyclodeaminase family protein [Suttonella ornithocola]|uniref:Ornithine cyclodeaminase n=1 Tax=Suttonella ornithocola TaxID=279832 RepID=A0A380MWV9_9GAMM|nr:ornithine cyclodeaminase family protein [Suttonella ornithocola]SUO95897.1 ornithine cyclodeaminase [Suttonella ornithocola]